MRPPPVLPAVGAERTASALEDPRRAPVIGAASGSARLQYEPAGDLRPPREALCLDRGDRGSRPSAPIYWMVRALRWWDTIAGELGAPAFRVVTQGKATRHGGPWLRTGFPILIVPLDEHAANSIPETSGTVLPELLVATHGDRTVLLITHELAGPVELRTVCRGHVGPQGRSLRRITKPTGPSRRRVQPLARADPPAAGQRHGTAAAGGLSR